MEGGLWWNTDGDVKARDDFEGGSSIVNETKNKWSRTRKIKVLNSSKVCIVKVLSNYLNEHNESLLNPLRVKEEVTEREVDKSFESWATERSFSKTLNSVNPFSCFSLYCCMKFISSVGSVFLRDKNWRIKSRSLKPESSSFSRSNRS